MSIYTQQKPLNIVAVSGGLNHPSKTESLIQAILEELSQAIEVNVHFVKLSEIGPLLGGAIYRNQLPKQVQDDLAAIEAADVVLMDDNPDKLPVAIRIARKTKRIVRENIVFALGVKGIVLILGALGLANMWAAVFADVGVAMIAICNAIRTLRIK